jgi:hypothetical protein
MQPGLVGCILVPRWLQKVLQKFKTGWDLQEKGIDERSLFQFRERLTRNQ